MAIPARRRWRLYLRTIAAVSWPARHREAGHSLDLRRADHEWMLAAIQDADDITALRTAEAGERETGKEAMRADHLPVELVMRLMAGEQPLRIWREHRGLAPQALAEKAGVAHGDLVDLEEGKTPGSMAAYRRLADALGVAVDDVLPPDQDERAD